MPEHNFEQQARDMANGFEMKPQSKVWQNVRNAIQQPQRKRRFVLWWWLLPLALIGGGVTWYKLSKAHNEIAIAKAIHQANSDKNTTPAKQQNNRQQTGVSSGLKKEDSTTLLLSENNNLASKQSTETKAFKKIEKKKNSSFNATDKRTIARNKTDEQANMVGNELDRNSITFSIVANDKNNHASDSTIALMNTLQPHRDSLQIMSLLKDSAFPIKSVPSKKFAVKNAGSISINISDSAGNGKSSGTKKATSKLHWGVIAEGGIATRKSSVLSFAGFEKSSNTTTFPSANDAGSGSAGSPGSRAFHYNSQIQPGAAFRIGVALQKKINNSIDVFADAAYHYQSYKVSTTAYRDSLVLNNLSASVAGNYKTTQAFHFTSLFAGINWHFINTKHIQFGISAGADNLFLIAANQKLHSVSGSNFSSSVTIRISDSAFTKGNFYQYQPSLFAGVLFTIKKGNQQLQLIPFTRSSIRSFDKYAISDNKHLFSAGLRAVYFFK
ncbi:hypothetical protein FC093_09015 [Ilyomonas limi]|uniref:Outer membrane protein beta-barrel domain-containing protein n=1 Tax=Ilyomonas limi TaxID=2575867 RepID=A0A4U3L569_9BACT|nr:hypothetical protein [Ilyomonas limi]TKK68826.1 hypothetical protein FC093_09015 [Ilyomonas limi]